jgi:hypothetical protein
VVKLLACLVALSGCELFVDVPNATLANAGSNDGGTGTPCTASLTCNAPTPVCDTSHGTCVECVTSPDCTVPERAICDANVCRGCISDAECPSSNVCLGDGTCADPARVLFASTAGGATGCTAATPCTLDAAYAMVSATQDIIKLAAGTYARDVSLTVTKDVIVTGEGATFQDTSAQTFMMFDVMGVSMSVLNVDFELANTAAGTNAYAAECTMSGALHFDRVRLANGAAGAYVNACAFTLDRSTVDGNSFYGFYLVGAQITITNSFITNNGATSQGGMVLSTGTTGTIEHVTMSGNTSMMSAHAITCTDPGLVIRSSIIYGNGTPSIDPACVVGHSVVDPDYTGGANNLSVDPLFVAAGNYHIQAGSPAVGLADPASLESVDVDGDPRPQPIGSMADSGADEIP